MPKYEVKIIETDILDPVTRKPTGQKKVVRARFGVDDFAKSLMEKRFPDRYVVDGKTKTKDHYELLKANEEVKDFQATVSQSNMIKEAVQEVLAQKG